MISLDFACEIRYFRKTLSKDQKQFFSLRTLNFWTIPEFFAIMRIFLHNIFQTSLNDLRMRFNSICCTIFFPVSLSELIYHKWLKIQSQFYQNCANYLGITKFLSASFLNITKPPIIVVRPSSIPFIKKSSCSIKVNASYP